MIPPYIEEHIRRSLQLKQPSVLERDCSMATLAVSAKHHATQQY
jgi:hypothetical protein